MYKKATQSGFTLIEMIVSLALFSVVVTTAVGALLILIAANRQLQNEQSILSNLSFALDSMTREIRTGSHYFCAAGTSDTAGSNGERIFSSTPGHAYLSDRFDSGDRYGNCASGNTSNLVYHGISFDEGGQSVTNGASSRRIAYFHNDGKLYRRLSGTAVIPSPPESIVSAGIYIASAEFFVSSSYPLFHSSSNAEAVQPKVTIFLEAYPSEEAYLADENDGSGAREFSHKIQTTVTQRSLDI